MRICRGCPKLKELKRPSVYCYICPYIKEEEVYEGEQNKERKGGNMKYRIDLTIDGYIEIEASSEAEARDRIDGGYSLQDITVTDDDINEIVLLEQ